MSISKADPIVLGIAVGKHGIERAIAVQISYRHGGAVEAIRADVVTRELPLAISDTKPIGLRLAIRKHGVELFVAVGIRS